MLQGSDATFGEAAVWLLVCVAAWVGVRRWIGPWTRAHPRLAIAGAAAIARAVPALVLDRGLFFDIEAHWWIGSLTLSGQNVYTAQLAHNRYPYPPLHMYLSALMVWLSGQDRAIFMIVDKLLPAVCGVGIALAIRATALRLGMSQERALLLGLLYAVNPLPVLVTSYHGQFEEIPVFFIVLAVMLLAGERHSSGIVALSALSLGIAVAYKTWPLLFLPALVVAVRGLPRKALYLPLSVLPIAVSVALFGLAFGPGGRREATQRILDYKGSTGFCWGYVSALHSCWVHPERLRPNTWILTLNGKLLLVGLAVAGLLLLWRRRPLESMVVFPLVFYLFSPGWGPNYSIWVLPFALLLSERLARWYTWLLLPIVALTYLDSLYAAYGHTVFSWVVLKPAEAALGLAAWTGVVALLAWVYLVDGRSSKRSAPRRTPGRVRSGIAWPRPSRTAAVE